MKQPEYTEGTEALENFKRLATETLQAPAKKKRQTMKSASQRASKYPNSSHPAHSLQ
jgi:hypothetical protein